MPFWVIHAGYEGGYIHYKQKYIPVLAVFVNFIIFIFCILS